MATGKSRFEYYLIQAEALMQKASASVNPALWLYQNNARTTIFMLEGLAKLYGGLHNPKKFGKLKDRFKLVEDGIGAIDYYDNVAKDLRDKQGLPEFVLSYAQAQAREKIQRLNDLLQEEKWLATDNSRVNRIREKLAEADWMKPAKEMEAIRRFYLSEIKEIIASIPEQFTEMELGVHEIRRQLRWLSIYPQAMQGCIQLKDDAEQDTACIKYLTPDIVSSPFNRMPAAENETSILYLSRQHFLALSWMISETGRIKDEGLLIMAVAEALSSHVRMKQEPALEEACRLLDKPAETIGQLLNRASQACMTFKQEGHLQKMVLEVDLVA